LKIAVKRGITLAVLLAVVLMMAAAPVAFASGNRWAPYDLTVRPPDSSAGGVLRLAWRVDDPSGISQYRVYRSSEADSGFQLVGTQQVNLSSGNRMDHFDSGLQDGSTYYYKVALIGRDGTETGRTGAVKGVLPPAVRKASVYQGKRIVISVADQVIYFLENEVLVKSHLCSTGTGSHPTPFGVFQIEWHQQLVISELYGDAYCYWWMNFAPDTGMHALPYDPDSGSYYGWDSLGSRASHGCVRQAPDNAKWAYDWTPNGTRVDVIGWSFAPNVTPAPAPAPAPPPINGGHASQGISSVSNDWYLAEGCTSGNFNEYVLMMNPTGVDANVEAEFMKPDGSVVNRTYTVPTLSRFTVKVDDIEGLQETEVSTRLHSDQLITAERAMYFDDYGGKNGGTCSAAVSQPAKTWYLAEGFTGRSFDEYILVQNPGDADGTVRVNYMRSDGQNFIEERDIKAHSRLSIHVDDIPELADAEVSAKVTCNRPVVVERAMYFDYEDRDDGNASAAVRTPAKTWYLAEGYTGGSFDTYVLIQNPGGATGTARVTFMCSDGENISKTYRLKPRSRFSIPVDKVEGLENKEVSTFIKTDVDVIAERAMYFDSGGRTGGADAPGISELATYWYLAEGYTGGDFDTYVLLMNPHDEAIKVYVTFLLPDGEQKPFEYTIDPNSRYTIHVDAVEGMDNTEVSTAVTGEKPIICERAMYFSTSL
jgi:L,D-transpeptidase catalytic domain/Family of unknown function (DUF5719)